MKRNWLLIALCLICSVNVFAGEIEEQNKALARRFYEEIWFKNNPAVVDELVAPTYIAHDIGDRKNSMEQADEQKKIAAFFWERGEMTGSIDYQIAEGDLVATRWQWHFKPNVWWMKILGGEEHIPIINVFRFRDGKIVEVWNHRHDIDTGMANLIFVKGLVVGLIPAILIFVILLVSWFRRKRKVPIPAEAGVKVAILLAVVLGVTPASSRILAQSGGNQPATVSKLGKFFVPKSAKALEGIIIVGVSVDATGRVTSVDSVTGPGDICPQVTRPDVLSVRNAARRAAISTKFVPSKYDGQPYPSSTSLEFQLALRKKADKSNGDREVYFVKAAPSPIEPSASPDQLSGGVINGKADSLPKPPYPASARSVGASGAIPVQVLIDEEGNVFSARAVSGHPLLRATSVAAACRAKFSPTRLSGHPVKVSGIITYNFVR